MKTEEPTVRAAWGRLNCKTPTSSPT